MAISSLNLQPFNDCQLQRTKPLQTLSPWLSHFTKLQFRFSNISTNNRKASSFHLPSSARVNEFWSLSEVTRKGNTKAYYTKIFQRFCSILPGGNWWDLCDQEEVESRTTAAITVLHAVQRMWGLVANDRWIIYAAFGSVFLAAVSALETLFIVLDVSNQI